MYGQLYMEGKWIVDMWERGKMYMGGKWILKFNMCEMNAGRCTWKVSA
jgi:hypothetical protein